jgi:ribosomal protein L20A (L18A)
MVALLSGAELQQFVCAIGWMRTALPMFTKLIGPLSELLETVYAKAGARSKVAAARIQLAEVGWNEKHTVAFEECKVALANAATL